MGWKRIINERPSINYTRWARTIVGWKRYGYASFLVFFVLLSENHSGMETNTHSPLFLNTSMGWARTIVGWKRETTSTLFLWSLLLSENHSGMETFLMHVYTHKQILGWARTIVGWKHWEQVCKWRSFKCWARTIVGWKHVSAFSIMEAAIVEREP